MRIAFWAINLGRELKGGELYVHHLARALGARGNDVTVYVSAAYKCNDYRVVRVPVPYVQSWRHATPLAVSATALGRRVARGLTRRMHSLFAAATAADLLRRRPHIVVPMFGTVEMTWARLVRKMVGAHVVTVGHGTAGDDAASIIAHPDAFVATSPRQAEWARYFGSTQVALIPLGVDLELFKPHGPVVDHELERPVFLTVGSLSPVKRVDLSVTAVIAFGRGSLLVVGDGPLAENIDRMASERLGSGRYLRLPSVEHRELPRFYRTADMLIFPSDTTETAGLVPIEALACGCPVVAVDDDVRRWLLKDAADFADPTDSIAMVAAMERALERRDRDLLRSSVSRLDWRNIAGQHEALYATLSRHAATP
jgi:glycosyltransferase involved in cell wall biosynthesis